MIEESLLPDSVAVRRAADKAAETYVNAAVVGLEIGNRMHSRLDYMAIMPSVVLDLGCGAATSLSILQKRYKRSLILGADFSHSMLMQRRNKRTLFRKPKLIQLDATAIALQNESCDLVVSNLMLPLCANPLHVFKEVNRVLKPEGAFLFTSLGPDSMRSLIDVLTAADPGNPRIAFRDMHDLGDLMVQAGMTQPVLDAEYLRIDYSSARNMLQELRHCGATNVALGRSKGLMTPTIYQRIESLCAGMANVGFELEVIQGHVWKRHAGSGIEMMPDSLLKKFIPINLERSK